MTPGEGQLLLEGAEEGQEQGEGEGSQSLDMA